LILSEEGPTSDWIKWCRTESDVTRLWIHNNWWILTPDPKANLITITDRSSIEFWGEKYRSHCNRIRGTLNFQAMYEDGFDGVHITTQGIRASRFEEDWCTRAWDVESTVWFRWKFTDYELLYTSRPKEVVAR
jgi:hypothetical protein